MDVRLEHPAFRATVADVAAAADRLRTDRDRVTRQVDVLLDGGWSGPAAAAYAEGWSDWCAGAERVLDGLVEMGRLLAAVHADLTERDLGSQSAIDRLTARLG
ncbi:WXG100 family type VII secretion target [Nocardioides endophyticus]